MIDSLTIVDLYKLFDPQEPTSKTCTCTCGSNSRQETPENQVNAFPN